MRLSRKTPMDWRKDWALHRRKTGTDSLGDAVAVYDMDTPDFTGTAGTASGVCWQVKSQEWAVKEFGEGATGGATFDLFLDTPEISPFDRCVFGGGVWEVRSVIPRSDHGTSRSLQWMHMEIEIKGLTGMTAILDALEKDGAAAVEQFAKQQAQVLATEAQGKVYSRVNFRDGTIRDSLQGACVREPDGNISFGVKTNSIAAIAHEFGTGPVGTAAGYPGEALADPMLARKTEGWTYWSDDVAALRMAQDGGGEPNGYVYTEGVPAQHFIHDAMQAKKEESFQGCVQALENVIYGK